jgi:choice-of-anchor B domain-containing protein
MILHLFTSALKELDNIKNWSFYMIKLLVLSLLCTSAYASTQNVATSNNALLESSLDLKVGAISAKRGNDIWGWTDPENQKEYAIMGLDSKTSFVDVTDPKNPIHLADLKTATSSSTWRDIKIYKHYAYVVSEAWRHGIQIFDLHRLRGMDGEKVQKVTADARNRDFGSAHNIFINEDSGFAYAVGAKTCDGGLHIMDLKNPLAPKFVNCVGRGVYEIPTKHGDAYTHDVQCVIYNGPDINFLGQEICVSSNEDTVNIVNVTDKNKPYQISSASYDGVKYTHQGWLTEDHKYFLLGDELDEQRFGTNTKTFIWDFSDLTNPKNFAVYEHNSKAIDHNMYVKGNYVYQANYNAGLRILDLTDINEGVLTEVGFVDTMPNVDSAVFEGVWSVFPYYNSGTVAISGINGVLYLTRPNLK